MTADGSRPPRRRDMKLDEPLVAHVVEAGHSEADGADRREAPGAGPPVQVSLWREFVVAVFSVFMGVSNAISLGAIVFPHNEEFPNTEFVSMGMSIGLLTSAVSNLVLAMGSQMPHSVGGPIMVVVPFMANYFKEAFGPGEPYMCLLCVPLMTTLTGLLTCVAGYLRIGDIIQLAPAPFFAGFMSGLGLLMMQIALNMMYPGFKAFVDPGSLMALGTAEFWLHTGPGLATALFVFVLPKCTDSELVGDFLLPVTMIAVAALFFATLALLGVSLAEARAAGWLFDVEVPSRINCTKLWEMLATGLTSSSVPLHKIFSASFAVASLEVFCICLLPLGENLLSATQGTQSCIDFNKEIRVIGLSNALTGVVGGMPGCIVGSSTITAHKLGARSRYFSWFQVALSMLVFAVGEYVIALTPKMVLAFIFIWLGMLFLEIFAWGYLGKVTTYEFGTIMVIMVAMVTRGVGCAILVGVLAALLEHLLRQPDADPLPFIHSPGAIRRSSSVASDRGSM